MATKLSLASPVKRGSRGAPIQSGGVTQSQFIALLKKNKVVISEAGNFVDVATGDEIIIDRPSSPYIAFATSDSGANFTLTQNPSSTWMAIRFSATEIVSPSPSDFAGIWFQRLGVDGVDGVNGENGIDGVDGIDGIDGANAYSYTAYGSSISGAGFTLVFDALLEYRATISSVTPIASPILADFAGAWFKSSGDLGPTGAQGNKAGGRYAMSNNTAIAAPGAGFLRFNAASPTAASAVTHMAVHTTAQSSISQALIMATWLINDVITIESNSNSGTAIFTALITNKTLNGSGTWYDFTVQYISGVIIPNSEQVVVRCTATGIRSDGNGNFVDAQGNVISGIASGTYADMAALTVANYNREYFHVTDYGVGSKGIRYRSDAAEWFSDGDQLIADLHSTFNYIAPNTVATAIASVTILGVAKTRITAVAHTLTTAEAVTAGGTAGVNISITSWTGTGVAGFYKILAVGTDTIDIDLAYSSGYGVPTIVQKNVEIVAPFSIALPPLNNNSTVLYDPEYICTASTDAKYFAAYLGGTGKLSRASNIGASAQLVRGLFGFRNTGVKTAQETLGSENSLQGTGALNGPPIATPINTAVSTALTFRLQPVVANQMMGIKHVAVRLRG